MEYAPSNLMQDIIALTEKRYATAQDIQQLSRYLVVKNSGVEIAFFREIKRLIRLLPLDTFIDEEQRQNLIMACQMALDNAIEREEEGLQSVREP